MAPLGDGGAAPAAGNNLVVSFGEMLIDFVPDVAGLSLAESGGFVKAPGGAPANVACAIAKLGGSSAFLGKVRPVAVPSITHSEPSHSAGQQVF
jgi:fructokinase